MLSFSTTVLVSLEEVWADLLHKIEFPENFVPGVSNVKIVEKQSDAVIREMTITTPENSFSITERITFSPYKVRFQILDHPIYEGYVDNEARPLQQKETEIIFSLYWKNKTTGELVQNQNIIEAAVLKTKEYMENKTKNQ